jgi:citrate-Mg2+:H+ or citrate-Ca2+:H+ symporter, CitMHS family
MSPFTALIVIPIIFGLASGAGFGLGKMMLTGIRGIATTATMLLFAIMYFGIMINAGLFDPLVIKILKLVKGDPLKVIVGTVFLTGFVALDGDGSTTFMIVCTAMLPLYLRLGISPIILAVFALMTNNVLNLIPWGGPTARVVAVLKLEAPEVFNPLIPGMIVSFIFIVIVAYFVGQRERARIGKGSIDQEALLAIITAVETENQHLKRPKLFWINLLLTVALVAGLVLEWAPLAVLFEFGTAIALLVNYRSLSEQRDRFAEHAPAALNVIGVIFAAGIFMGILTGTKMADAIAKALIQSIPASFGPHMAVITALLSGPGTFFLSNDAFYFGIVPVLSQMAGAYGITPSEIARASLMGQPLHFLSPLIGALWLLLGITNTNLGDVQKWAFPVAVGMMIIYIVTGVLTGAIPA